MAIVDLKRLSEITSIPVPTLRAFIKMGMPCYQPMRKIYADTVEFNKWLKISKIEIKKNIQDIDNIVKNAIRMLRE